MNRIILVLGLVAFGALLAGCVMFQDMSEPVEFGEEFNVNVMQYGGLWYEHARTSNSFQDNRPERNGVRYGPCTNTTAEYGMITLFKLSVQNRCERYSESGDLFVEIINGTANIIPETQNRKISVAFGPPFLQFLQRVFLGSNYWIYCIGPVQSSEYQWAVVSGQQKDFIFILTRDQFISDELQSEILDCARREGLPVDQLTYMQGAF